ncbi:hypothetical protein BRETT_001975 [Brettanomyces bruxellensis]|uniref:Uncharacterized protein n=1 Tax=Dekkera bruxellensis TaxID=5007 RepID=A0A871RHA0_DEKBR|nr:uncharacterized protein BRETT_001975 [Brettanomyces bruxellensis]QOU21811.1 hypothetical protein BRETT_001975 [Brettanomyces bruxellensis]
MFPRLSRTVTLGVRNYATKSGGDFQYGDLLSRLSKISQSKQNADFQRTKNKPESKGKEFDRQEVTAKQRERSNFNNKRDAKKNTLERKMSRFRRRPEDEASRKGTRRRGKLNLGERKMDMEPGFEAGSSSAGPNEEKVFRELIDKRTKALASFIEEIFGDSKKKVKKPIDEGLLKDLFLRVDSEMGKNENESNMEEVSLEEKNAKEMEERSQYIERKRIPEDILPPTLDEIRNNFQNSAVIKTLFSIKDYDGNFMHDVTHPAPTKIPFNTENRILIAVEKVLARRGISIEDGKLADRFFECKSTIHSFENPLKAKNEITINPNIRKLADIPEKELEKAIAETVDGARNEIRPIINENQTERARLNAQVVANALNSNAQLKVDDIHIKLSEVLTGQKGLKELPKLEN